MNEPIHQCAHCGTEGQDLRVQILTYFADFEDLYCKHCRAKAISINGEHAMDYNAILDKGAMDLVPPQGPTPQCDGCKSLGPNLNPPYTVFT